jgi:acetyl-CoA carboxylase carboxyltransferase component
MGAQQAVGIVDRRAIDAADDPVRERERLGRRYAAEHLTALNAVADGHVDEIVAPSETRARVAAALASLETATRPSRPAGNLPL